MRVRPKSQVFQSKQSHQSCIVLLIKGKLTPNHYISLCGVISDLDKTNFIQMIEVKV